MSLLDEVVCWAESAPAWVRDALRRIATQDDLTEEDFAELAELCKRPHGLSDARAEAQPIIAAHLPSAAGSATVSLLSLTHLSDVNALAAGETLTCRKDGLVVVYGDNGSGKSGYARILKRACRARGGGEPILPNALSDEPGGTPTAMIRVDVDGEEREHVWKDGTPCAAELSAISVFDASAAQVYVGDKTEVRFRPLGLDIRRLRRRMN